jgi:putative endopeptidase
MILNTSRGARWTGVAAALLLAGGLQAQTLGVDTTGFDRSVRPQDDFFAFVNGSWVRNTPIPQDRASYGSSAILSERSEQTLRQIVEEAAAAPSRAPGSDAQKVGDLYLSFMDTAAIEAAGITPLQADLARVRALASARDLPAQFAANRRLGVGSAFSFSVGQDPRVSSRYAVSIGQGGLGMPDRDYYLQQGERFTPVREAYLRYVETLLRLSGEADPAGAARRVMALETEIARRQWDRTRNRNRDLTYNRMSVAELQALTPSFSWAAYLQGAGVTGVDSVIVRQPGYLRAVDSLFTSVPAADWKAYLQVRLLDDAAPYLSRDFVEASFAFRGRTLQGLQEMRPRWKRGVSVVQDAMGETLGKMYVERTFTPAAKERMEALVANLLEAFRQGIDSLEWMSPATRAQAHDKLAKINVKIGYPDRWRDYSALEVRPGDLFGNVRRTAAFEYQRMIGRLGSPVDRGEWGMYPQTVNAYYSPSNNEIVFPAAILQPPFFDANADDAVNYGAIGGVIGHEISHGFDDQGRKSDGDGNLRDWWTPEDAAAFEQRANALVAQYGAYSPLEGMNVNGRLTLGENIGDVSGLAVAYRAYQLSLRGREAPVIGGFTGDQRFFLGWAQVWRNKYRDENLRERLMTDTHSPAMYRTNGVLVNFPAFYEAWGVKPGDRMYLAPEQRVKIW